MRNSEKMSGFMKTLSVFTVILASLAYSSQTLSDSPKRTISVRFSKDPERIKLDLKELGQFDVLGVDHKSHYAQLSVSQSEIKALQKMGFAFSFSQSIDEQENLSAEDTQGYLQPDQVLALLSSTERAFPNLAKVIELGKTTRNRSLQAIVLSSNPSDTSRPTVLFNGMHHARELMTTEIMAHLVRTLTEGYSRDPEIKRWMDKYRIVVVPQVNPDGNTLVFGGQTMWRKNAWNSNGRTVGVDLNRNYPTLWNSCEGSSGSKGSDSYRGPSAASEPETQALMNLVKTYKPVMNISYHSYSELIIYPFGCSGETNSSLGLFKEIAGQMKAEIIDDSGRKNTYSIGSAPELLYPADGTDTDWQWKEQGVVSFAIEANSTSRGFQPNFRQWRDITVKRQEGAWKQMLRRMEKGAVRANIVTQSEASDITYTLDAASTGGFTAWTTDQSVAPFRLKNESGLLYQLLQDGEYRINLFRHGQLIQRVPVKIEGAVTDLGTIHVD